MVKWSASILAATIAALCVLASIASAAVTTPRVTAPSVSSAGLVVAKSSVPAGWSQTLELLGPSGQDVRKSSVGGRLAAKAPCTPATDGYEWEARLTYTEPGQAPVEARKPHLLACR